MTGLEMRYFILKPKGTDEYAQASRAALRAYAKSISEENPALVTDLWNWAFGEMIASLQEDEKCFNS